MTSAIKSKAVEELLGAFQQYSRDFLRILEEKRNGSMSSYKNATRALAYDILTQRRGRDPSFFTAPALDVPKISKDLNSRTLGMMFTQIMVDERDLFWLEDVQGGGYIAHTPDSMLILGAGKFAVKEEANDAEIAIYSSGRTPGLRAPSLGSFDHSTFIKGAPLLFYEEAEAASPDLKYKIRRINDYNVVVEGPGSKRWKVSLIDQFVNAVREIADEEEYTRAWEDLSDLINMNVENQRRTLIKKAKKLDEDERNEINYDNLAKNLGTLKLVMTAIDPFKNNRHMNGSWDQAFVTTQIDILTDKLSWWLDTVPADTKTADLELFRRIFEIEEVIGSCSELLCPISYLSALSKVKAIREHLHIDVKTQQKGPIEIRKAADLRKTINYLIHLIGKSSSYDRSQAERPSIYELTRIEVKYGGAKRGLSFANKTETHSAFAAFDEDSDERNGLDRLAKSAGFKVKYGWDNISLVETNDAKQNGGDGENGGGDDDKPPAKVVGSFGKFPIPGIHKELSSFARTTPFRSRGLGAGNPLTFITALKPLASTRRPI